MHKNLKREQPNTTWIHSSYKSSSNWIFKSWDPRRKSRQCMETESSTSELWQLLREHSPPGTRHMEAGGPTTPLSGTPTTGLMPLKLSKQLLFLRLCSHLATKCFGALTLVKCKCVPKRPTKHSTSRGILFKVKSVAKFFNEQSCA